MTSSGIVMAIVVAVLVVAVAVQLTARHLQRFPVDPRRNGTLFETTRETKWVLRPAELEQLGLIVSESLSSDAVARSKLHPLLDELERAAPGRGDRSTTGAPSTRRHRRDRGRAIEARLAALEAAWGIDDRR